MTVNNPLSYGSILSYLKVLKCFQEELKKFQKSIPGSSNENRLWNQCEKRLQEIEMYKDMPDDIAGLILMHVRHSQSRAKGKQIELDEGQP